MNLKMESYLLVNLLGPGPRLVKKKIFSSGGLTEFVKHWSRVRIYDTPRYGRGIWFMGDGIL